LKTEVF